MKNFSKETKLGEIECECKNHQRMNKDCDSCKFYTLCVNKLCVSYPSGWDLEDGIKEPIILHCDEDKDKIYVICKECNTVVCEYSIEFDFGNKDYANQVLVEDPKELYSNYCKHCGVKLK